MIILLTISNEQSLLISIVAGFCFSVLAAFAYSYFLKFLDERKLKELYTDLISKDFRPTILFSYSVNTQVGGLSGINTSVALGVNSLTYTDTGIFEIEYWFVNFYDFDDEELCNIMQSDSHSGRLILTDKLLGTLNFEQDIMLNGIRNVFLRYITNSKNETILIIVSNNLDGSLANIYCKLPPKELEKWLLEYKVVLENKE